MNPSQYTSIGVTAAMLAPVIKWLFTWPLTTPTDAQAGGIAALLIAAGGAVHSAVRSRQAGRASEGPAEVHE